MVTFENGKVYKTLYFNLPGGSVKVELRGADAIDVNNRLEKYIKGINTDVNQLIEDVKKIKEAKILEVNLKNNDKKVQKEKEEIKQKPQKKKKK